MKIFCVGRNYITHAKELNNEIPKEPVIFMKPETALLCNNNNFLIPDFSKEIHYECELVYRICKTGKNIKETLACNFYKEIGLGIDFTARDLQTKLKNKGLPWEKAKSFDNSAAISSVFIPLKNISDKNLITFSLKKNGEKVQSGNSKFMIFPIDRIISHISNFFTLEVEDLIYTGTPEGVGQVSSGDRLEGFIGDKKMFDFGIE